MKVFVTGATGFIGSRVARAFRRAGHQVWGLTRSAEKARELEKHEIYAVIGDMHDPSAFALAAARCSVAVHAAVEPGAQQFDLDRRAVESLQAGGARLIYTSGCWIYGDTGGHLVDERGPLHPAKKVSLRPGIEHEVLDKDGIVLRPGCVYGGEGSLTATWFEDAWEHKKLRHVGPGTNSWAMVHVEDLADAYVRVAEKGLRREVFNLTDGSASTVSEMIRAVGRVAGLSGNPEILPVTDPFEECLALSQKLDSGKAQGMLGWNPRHPGFVAGVEEHFLAWKAGRPG